jgi:hypothetical protein
MKIEDSPYGFSNQFSVEKVKRPSSAEGMLDAFDLSFLDLLTSVTETTSEALIKPEEILPAKQKEVPKATEKATEKPKLTLVESPRKTDRTTEDSVTHVEKDMTLLNTDLTTTDQQYLKQVVIPGLPILLGSVPFESIFPPDDSGNISYRSFEISPKLAELIEKGYKTGRPIRVELDPNSAVVLKIRNGQVSAEFVSADKTASIVMQQELDQLRNRMIAKNLPVGNLEYKYRNPEQQQNQQSEEDKSEN